MVRVLREPDEHLQKKVVLVHGRNWLHAQIAQQSPKPLPPGFDAAGESTRPSARHRRQQIHRGLTTQDASMLTGASSRVRRTRPPVARCRSESPAAGAELTENRHTRCAPIADVVVAGRQARRIGILFEYPSLQPQQGPPLAVNMSVSGFGAALCAPQGPSLIRSEAPPWGRREAR